MNKPRFVIIGVGAVGGSIAVLIEETKASIAMVARGDHGSAIRKDGLQLQLYDKKIVSNAECFESVKDVNWQANDIAVVATKLNDAESVFDEILDVAGSKIPVVCATNGLAAESWAEARFENVVSMLVWIPATHLQPGKVMLHSEIPRGVLDVGTIKGDSKFADLITETLRSAKFESVVQQDILAWKRAKLITNLGGAAQALIADDWMPVLLAAQAEGERVLAAADFPRVQTDQLLERCSNIKMSGEDGFERLGGSTWQSQKRGKPLESIYIEGAIASLGETLGISVPVNRFLAEASKNPRSLTSDEVLNC